MTIDEASEFADGSKYNDCGDYWTTCLFFVFYQVRISKGREVERLRGRWVVMVYVCTRGFLHLDSQVRTDYRLPRVRTAEAHDLKICKPTSDPNLHIYSRI